MSTLQDFSYESLVARLSNHIFSQEDFDNLSSRSHTARLIVKVISKKTGKAVVRPKNFNTLKAAFRIYFDSYWLGRVSHFYGNTSVLGHAVLLPEKVNRKCAHFSRDPMALDGTKIIDVAVHRITSIGLTNFVRNQAAIDAVRNYELAHNYEVVIAVQFHTYYDIYNNCFARYSPASRSFNVGAIFPVYRYISNLCRVVETNVTKKIVL